MSQALKRFFSRFLSDCRLNRQDDYFIISCGYFPLTFRQGDCF
ncbi:hypothetical protein HMPREF0201_00249 [Cedecea davisae DSM 4568]|uniref:Uncharacterized protein n=1 Tax=Cedecea davisae DSM 4568 TaxID=566551 RepID=S3J7B7_9ENTR|nr:hypothetical protein HMPREF0201_00249 [Cedecea davisae DSM 4568]